MPRADVERLKVSLLDMKDQIAALREDNVRKAKLLSAMKSAKSADSNALEQWRGDARDAEDNVKR